MRSVLAPEWFSGDVSDGPKESSCWYAPKKAAGQAEQFCGSLGSHLGLENRFTYLAATRFVLEF